MKPNMSLFVQGSKSFVSLQLFCARLVLSIWATIHLMREKLLQHEPSSESNLTKDPALLISVDSFVQKGGLMDWSFSGDKGRICGNIVRRNKGSDSGFRDLGIVIEYGSKPNPETFHI
ncbi:hypothetical protein MRB53_018315 [Persea americana]|uniref:Uncharacterized protein n=1 Tax=Persea americana TaxID=3435 RepID=A0ACC2M747_PERAE|nr:hypothetical protein MRB53_018315 [Persea americana]